MKILIQHSRNKLYLKRLGVWTSNPHAAFNFEHSQRAIDFAREHALADVNLAVKFSDPQCDQTMPIPDPEPALPQNAT